MKSVSITVTSGLLSFALAYTSSLAAADLNLADTALEVVGGTEPNILLLEDNSLSMDFGILNPDEEFDGTYYLGLVPYYYVHPAPGATGNAPATNVASPFTLPTEEHLKDEGVAAPYGGVWRAWNSDYNRIYYNPQITYKPWRGLDANSKPYANVDPTAAPYNPYRPGDGALNLTVRIQYDSVCKASMCDTIPDLDLIFSVEDFLPARYYTWTDSDGDKEVDDDDGHTLVEITPGFSELRQSHDADTGIGRSDCTDQLNGTTLCNYNQELQNFANWFSYYRKRDLVAKASLSHAIDPIAEARIGFAGINDNAADNLPVASMNISPLNGNKLTLYDRLFSTVPKLDTPLRSALDKAGRYFECESGDIFGSASDTSPGNAACPIPAAPQGNCQANYTVLMSDGYWNGTDPTLGNTDSGSGDFSGGAFADGYSNTLADVAMHYYKRDLHGLDNKVPTTALDISRYLGTADPFETMHQHMKTYTVGFGISGDISVDPGDPAVAFSWPDPTSGIEEKIDDMRHAAYNGRGLYLNANNQRELSARMKTIFSDIKANAGTATAVAFNTQEVEAGTLVFRASFNTKTHVGNLVAQRVLPNGTIEDAEVWNAAAALDSKTGVSSDSRILITYKDTGSATSVGVPFRWASLDGGQQSLLDAPQPGGVAAATNTFGDERLAYLRGHSTDEGGNASIGEFRPRPLLQGKLGDIIHSTPVFVGKPQFINRDGSSYPNTTGSKYSEYASAKADRKQLVYTGANDGMLHAFDVSNGQEHFAYIPNKVTQNLSDLTDLNYTHQFYVDLTPSVNDAFITPARGTNASVASWNTVLVGGLGKGGKGYFALNVTDPEALDTEAEAAQNVMWEFTDADDPDLGYSYSHPLIAMSNATKDGQQRWVAIFGNGYNNNNGDGDAYLYVAFLEDGQDGVWTNSATVKDYIKIPTGKGIPESASGTPNGIGGIRGIDSDDNGTVDFVYAGDLQGNFYRFDLTSSSPGTWETNTPFELFQARYAAGDTFPRNIVQPITNQPIVMPHPDGGYLVIFGTGSWMTSDDPNDNSIQSLYGIWDDLGSSPVQMSSTSNQLVKQAFSNQLSKEHGFTVRTLSNNPVAYKNTGLSASQVKGWYIDLDVPPAGSTGVEYPGERAVRNLQLRGGILFVNTVIPVSTTDCTIGAGGFELGFNPFTGGSGSKTVFDLNNDGTFDYYDNFADFDADANIITGIRFDGGIPTDSAFIGHRRMTQVGQEVRTIGTNTKDDLITGRTSWREILP